MEVLCEIGFCIFFSNPDHSGKDILPRILEKQSLDVDVVSGATRRTALAKSG
ncbi:MAG TPA: hypothetical protein PK408_06535 [Treponemataceae bacterium]|nr:hypothetical protein [Treponemataceae bacterium]